jgi:hypothetical protein
MSLCSLLALTDLVPPGFGYLGSEGNNRYVHHE